MVFSFNENEYTEIGLLGSRLSYGENEGEMLREMKFYWRNGNGITILDSLTFNYCIII